MKYFVTAIKDLILKHNLPASQILETKSILTLLGSTAPEIQYGDIQAGPHLVMLSMLSEFEQDIKDVKKLKIGLLPKSQHLETLVTKAVGAVKLIAGCISSFAGLSNFSDDMEG
jgi:hypothetical protein